MADTYTTKSGHPMKLVDNSDGTYSQAVELLKAGSYIGGSNPLNVKGNSSSVSDTCTRPDNTTAYAIGDVVGEDPAANLVFENVVRSSAATAIITGVTLEIDVAAIPSGMTGYRLHLYSSAPTAIADNSAYDLVSGDRAKYAGYIDIDTPIDMVSTLMVRMNNVNLQVVPSATTLYGMLETKTAYTPTAQAVKKVTLHCLEV